MEFTNLKQEICATWLQLNSEQMAQIRITLLELSSSVSHEIPRMREITRCSDFASSLRLLEKWKLLTPLKYVIFIAFFQYMYKVSNFQNCLYFFREILMHNKEHILL